MKLLRRERLTTAARLAKRLEVSERTIYRDIRDPVRTGAPIEGEAGVGYRLGKRFDLPPLMFDLDEVQALVLGARMVEAWGDDDLRQAARRAMDKVHVVLPTRVREQLENTALYALSHGDPQPARHMTALRHATHDRRILELHYRDRDDRATTRRVRPLGLYFWGPTWTLAAWCALRQAYRNFRLDRIPEVRDTGETFPHEPPFRLEDYIRAVTQDDP